MDEETVVAVKAVIVSNGEILLVKRADDDEFGAGTWECPGGKLDFGESLEKALKREVKEETGLSVSIERLLYATAFKTHPLRQVVLLTYLCRCQDRAVSLSHEHSDSLWANRNQIMARLPRNILADFEANQVFPIVGCKKCKTSKNVGENLKAQVN
ncbi:NUDIX domain-containing protein [Pullulanibacillus sp. KACC 23026]|uniref:NUDIX hydrolase n=1 Tax=Pullulanibacillus sp. KACC 23026 TaxID=3028315 RepID=UPI0023B155B3|nr:NUDIX domain-containing protein [Pullulanibacillus sp. KACC 23026]WEG11986.1 NUDIX domain-containing protein [Pullulanibacillus sp. KACC 23026]